MSITFTKYILGSVTAASIVAWNSYSARGQFYPTCVYLATSKAPMAIISNFLLALFLLFGKSVQKIFLGPLRDAEIEILTDKVWSTVVDTLFITTIFREELNIRFFSMFLALLFIKTLHWVLQERVDYIQQTVNASRLTYLRLYSLMLILLIVDSLFVYYCGLVFYASKGRSMMILFGFEYILLQCAMGVTVIKFFFSLYESRLQGHWENKGACILYLEFLADLYRLLVYVAFFLVILMHYGIPIHIIRQLYVTFSSFKDRVVEVIKYRAATKNMKSRFPDATPAELASAETCIVCRSEMREGKKLPCGHILHFACLRSWLERRHFCPTCMAPALVEDMPANANANNRDAARRNINNNANNNNNVNNNIAPQEEEVAQQQQHEMNIRNTTARRELKREDIIGTKNIIIDDPLEEIRRIQMDIRSLDIRLELLASSLSKMNSVNNTSVSTTANTKSPVTEEKETQPPKDEEELKDEELLRLALELSMQDANNKEEEHPGDTLEEIRKIRMARFNMT